MTLDLRLRTWWRLVLGLALTGALVTGVSVHLPSVAAGATTWADLPFSLSISALYTAVFTCFVFATFRAMMQARPPDRPADIALHVLAQAGAAVAAFVLSNRLSFLLLGGEYGLDAVTLTIVGNASALGTVLVGGALYLRAATLRAKAAEHAATEAQLAALRAQVNPHFLFNALNTIAALARVQPAEAERVTEHLADLFRYSLRASRVPVVPLAEELAAVDLYLGIERARYADRLALTVDVPDALLAWPVPSLLVQPLVENAVKHGVARSEAPVALRVAAHEATGTLVLTVTDSGPGFPDEPLAATLARGTGLANVAGRLRAHFGAAATLTRVPGGVQVTLPHLTPA